MGVLLPLKTGKILIDRKHPGYGELRHGNGVHAPGVMDLDPFRANIVQGHAVKADAGELNKAQVGEDFDGVMQKQTVADGPLDPSRVAGEGIGLLLQKNDLVSELLKLRNVRFGFIPRPGK